MKLSYLAAAVMALALILSGFASPPAKMEPVTGTVPLEHGSEAEAFVLIPKGEDPAVAAAAKFLADTLGGVLGLKLSVLESDDPMSALAMPEAYFSFVKTDDSLSILSGPFLYGGYEHFTMALNSKTVLSAVTEEFADRNAMPLAAYYTGSDYMLSNVNLDDFTSFRGMIIDGETEPDPESVPLLLLRQEDAVRRHAYEKSGSVVATEHLQAERLRRLLEGEAQISEFSFSDGPPEIGDWDENLFVTRSWQNSEPLWLMADAELANSLDNLQKGFLKEAAAALFSHVDGVFLQRENQVMTLLDESRLIKSIDYTRTRRSLSQYAAEMGPGMTDEEKRILSYINGIMPS